MYSWMPGKADEFLDWKWSQIEPIFINLQGQQLDDKNIETWLDEWSEISKILDEIHWRLYDATTVDTGNEAAEERFTRFLDEIRPKAKVCRTAFKRETAVERYSSGWIPGAAARSASARLIFSGKRTKRC